MPTSKKPKLVGGKFVSSDGSQPVVYIEKGWYPHQELYALLKQSEQQQIDVAQELLPLAKGKKK